MGDGGRGSRFLLLRTAVRANETFPAQRDYRGARGGVVGFRLYAKMDRRAAGNGRSDRLLRIRANILAGRAQTGIARRQATGYHVRSHGDSASLADFSGTPAAIGGCRPAAVRSAGGNFWRRANADGGLRRRAAAS